MRKIEGKSLTKSSCSLGKRDNGYAVLEFSEAATLNASKKHLENGNGLNRIRAGIAWLVKGVDSFTKKMN